MDIRDVFSRKISGRRALLVAGAAMASAGLGLGVALAQGAAAPFTAAQVTAGRAVYEANCLG